MRTSDSFGCAIHLMNSFHDLSISDLWKDAPRLLNVCFVSFTCSISWIRAPIRSLEYQVPSLECALHFLKCDPWCAPFLECASSAKWACSQYFWFRPPLWRQSISRVTCTSSLNQEPPNKWKRTRYPDPCMSTVSNVISKVCGFSLKEHVRMQSRQWCCRSRKARFISPSRRACQLFLS